VADVLWEKGGEADLASLDGDRIGVRSTIPSAPGSVLEGAFGEGGRLRLKVARCRRHEGGFAIDGRLLDPTRELRARIAARLRPAGDAG
jgi:hypothetical protein